MSPARGLGLVLIVGLAAASVASAEENWPRWRGPHMNGHAHEKGLPVEWSADDVEWKAPLEGWGQSSPVIWGDRIFLTTALDKGAKRLVLCFDRNDGSKLWEKLAWEGKPEPTHAMNSWASATCCTDGEHVYAFFGHGGGLFCYTVDGDLVWNVGNDKLGTFAGPWGTAACPVLVGDLVVQNCDSDKDSFIAAFDKKTGEQKWRTARPEVRGWSTPILLNVDGRDELILNGHHGPVAYDPETGKELWMAKDERGRGSPTATPTVGGRIVCVSGRSGGTIYAVEPGGSGEKPRIWSQPRKADRDLPSPISIGDHVMIVTMKLGLYTCYDGHTGDQVARGRLDGAFSAAPIAYDCKAFFVTESGTTYAIEPGDEMNVVATNSVGAGKGEIFRSSITPSEGQLFLRSDKFLYCVGTRKK